MKCLYQARKVSSHVFLCYRYCRSLRFWYLILELFRPYVKDRPFNLKGGLWFFVSFRKHFSEQRKSQNNICFCCAKRKLFFQKLTLGYMTKTLNQIIILFLHQNQNIFFSNIGNQNIFLEKNHNPSPQVKWSFPYANHEDMVIV